MFQIQWSCWSLHRRAILSRIQTPMFNIRGKSKQKLISCCLSMWALYLTVILEKWLSIEGECSRHLFHFSLYLLHLRPLSGPYIVNKRTQTSESVCFVNSYCCRPINKSDVWGLLHNVLYCFTLHTSFFYFKNTPTYVCV